MECEPHTDQLNYGAVAGPRRTRVFAMENSEPKTGLQFGNLPLIEVVVRASLVAPMPLTFRIVNKLAACLQEDFPAVAEMPVLERPPGLAQISVKHIPGAKYSGHRQALAVTVQDQLVTARWQRQITENPPPYPRFPALHRTLTRTISVLDEVCDTPPSVAVVNMMYVNLIPVAEARLPIQAYFSPEFRVTALEDAEALQAFTAAWRERDKIDLRLELHDVTARRGGQEFDAYRILTAGGVRLAASQQPDAMLCKVHDRLQGFFRRLLSEKAKDEWQLEDQ